MAVAVKAEISAATRIIRLEPLHAVGLRVATVAGAVDVGAGLIGVGAVAVIGSGKQSADDGAAEQGCTETRTPSSVAAPSSSAAAPSHGLDIRWGSIFECESIDDRRRRCIIRERHNAHCKQCRRSEDRRSVSHDVLSLLVCGPAAQKATNPYLSNAEQRRKFQLVICSWLMSASLIGRLGSSAFQTIHRFSVDVAHGLVLLFGNGTKALPSWDSKTRRNNLWVDLAVKRTAGSSGHTNSPHPSSREGHHSTAWWSSGFLLSHVVLISSHATAASRVQRNSVPSTQMRCMITARRRASATIALFIPRRLAIFIAQALSQDHFVERTSMTWARFVEHHPHHLVAAA